MLGFANLATEAPVGVQLPHLLLADLTWITWVLFTGPVLGAD